MCVCACLDIRLHFGLKESFKELLPNIENQFTLCSQNEIVYTFWLNGPPKKGKEKMKQRKG